MNWSALVTSLIARSAATVTFTVPEGLQSGAVAVTRVSELTVNDAAVASPNATAVAFVNPVPMIVTVAPPPSAALGLMEVTVGSVTVVVVVVVVEVDVGSDGLPPHVAVATTSAINNAPWVRVPVVMTLNGMCSCCR